MHEVVFFTDAGTGHGAPCSVLVADDGEYEIETIDGMRGWVTAGDLYAEDESGRYLGPVSE